MVAKYGLKDHQVFWNNRGEVCCSCCCIPYPGSDTWLSEQWEEINAETISEYGLACEYCGKIPTKIGGAK
jgi:hypothetical protein